MPLLANPLGSAGLTPAATSSVMDAIDEAYKATTSKSLDINGPPCSGCRYWLPRVDVYRKGSHCCEEHRLLGGVVVTLCTYHESDASQPSMCEDFSCFKPRESSI